MKLRWNVDVLRSRRKKTKKKIKVKEKRIKKGKT